MKPITLTGAEFKAWLLSPWGRPGHPTDDPMWDDVWVTIDGEGTDDPAPENIADTAKVVVEQGVVVFDQNRHDSPCIQAIRHIRAWREAQSVTWLSIAVPNEKLPAVKEWLANLGVKVSA